MTVGRLERPSRFREEPWQRPPQPPLPRRVTVLGAGLAGAGAARAFAERGIDVTVHDPAGIAGGASGQPALVLKPRLDPTRDAAVVRAAFEWTVARLATLDPERATWSDTGVFEPAVTFAERSRLFACATRHPELARWLDAEHTAAVTGHVDATHGGLWLPSAGIVRPHALCAHLLDHPRITFVQSAGTEIAPPDGLTVVATGIAARGLASAPWLGLRAARGQSTTFAPRPAAATPTAPLSRSGYLIGLPDDAVSTRWVVGGTFHRDDERTDRHDADDAQNRGRFDALPSLARALATAAVEDAHVGVRATTPEHVPRIGPLPVDDGSPVGAAWLPRIAVSVGHGARGAATALWAGELLAAWACGEPSPAADDLRAFVSPARVLLRRRQRGRAPGRATLADESERRTD